MDGKKESRWSCKNSEVQMATDIEIWVDEIEMCESESVFFFFAWIKSQSLMLIDIIQILVVHLLSCLKGHNIRKPLH